MLARDKVGPSGWRLAPHSHHDNPANHGNHPVFFFSYRAAKPAIDLETCTIQALAMYAILKMEHVSGLPAHSPAEVSRGSVPTYSHPGR
jgi:hypothetical protein